MAYRGVGSGMAAMTKDLAVGAASIVPPPDQRGVPPSGPRRGRPLSYDPNDPAQVEAQKQKRKDQKDTWRERRLTFDV